MKMRGFILTFLSIVALVDVCLALKVVLHPCVRKPCGPNGHCIKEDQGFRCQCDSGYGGQFCESRACVCHNGGLCYYRSGKPHCSCYFPFSGDHCEAHYCDITKDACANGGTCVKEPKGYSCKCPPDYTGRDCSHRFPMLPFPPRPSCKGASCTRDGPLIRCTCPEPLAGKKFEFCSCENGGTCDDTHGKTYCICPFPYTGKLCEAHFCDVTKDACRNGGTCVRDNAAPRCICPPNYTGPDCSKPKPCDCQNGGSCVYHGQLTRCTCPSAFTGAKCEAHFCDVATDFCANGGTCVRDPKGPRCKCIPYHYTGDRCTKARGPFYDHVCDAPEVCRGRGQCIKLQSQRYRCQCDPGYSGESCEYRIPSSSSTPSPSRVSTPQATSTVRVIHDHICDISRPCGYYGQCIKEPHGYRCQCDPGYSGQYCEHHLPSSSSTPSPSRVSTPQATPTVSVIHDHICDISRPCGYYGQCIKEPHGYRCQCDPGYSGQHCEHHAHYCDRVADLCANGGTCVKEPDGYSCKCPPDYTGRYCHAPLPTTPPPCDCQNGGSCNYNGLFSHCICPEAFTGAKCESHYCDVIKDLCANGSTCARDPTRPRCICPPNYTGYRCSEAMPTFPPPPPFRPAPDRNVRSEPEQDQEHQRVARDIKMDDDANEAKRVCEQNKLKAKTLFSDDSLTDEKWKALHPAIKAVLMDVAANDDDNVVLSTHAQIKKAVAGNDLMKMSRIMSERGLWKRVPLVRYWNRKRMMKKAVKNPWSSLVKNDSC